MVCLWHFEGDIQKAVKELKLAPNHSCFTTLPQALRNISFQPKTIAPD
jgi:hypothetical protein